MITMGAEPPTVMPDQTKPVQTLAAAMLAKLIRTASIVHSQAWLTPLLGLYE